MDATENSKNGDKVTLADVAGRAGVSQATVSRVIRRPSLVQPQTAVRVRAAMEELHYVAQRPENTLGSALIGISLPDVSDPFFAVLLKGIADAADLSHVSTLFHDAGNSLKIQSSGVERLVAQRPDALIVVPVSSDPEHAREIESHGIPLVYVDRVPTGREVHSITSDDHEGAFQATQCLLSMGHRSIVYIGGDSNLSTERNRLRGYRDALQAAGVAIRSELIHEHSFDQQKIAAVDPGVYLSDLDYTAVFAANDNLSAVVERWLVSRGRPVPEDVSLIGYGDMPFAAYLGLSSVSSPSYEMGRNAVVFAQALIEGRITETNGVVLKPRVLIRASCAPPRRRDLDAIR